jgi:diguanylate cyclase (GGDEF)-like protein
VRFSRRSATPILDGTAGVDVDAARQALAWLPRGGTLPRGVLEARHRGILVLLWAHVPVLAGLSAATGHDERHVVADVLLVAVPAAVASCRPYDRTSRWVAASLGLLLAAAVVVHVAHGTIEAHFHFFIVLGAIALYQEWTVFLLAVLFVTVHHAVLSVLLPHSVFSHAAGQAEPVRWALLHAAFVLAAACTHVVAWRSSEQGSYDGLTGLAGRAALVRTLERALGRGPAAVVFLDLDGFKQVNDELGHHAGDRLLVETAQRLQRAVREDDRVGRLGGDEFAVVLPGATAAEAERAAQRLLDEVAGPVVLPGGIAVLALSAGVAEGARGDGAEQLLRAADAAMYEAKRAGKGRFARSSG